MLLVVFINDNCHQFLLTACFNDILFAFGCFCLIKSSLSLWSVCLLRFCVTTHTHTHIYFMSWLCRCWPLTISAQVNVGFDNRQWQHLCHLLQYGFNKQLHFKLLTERQSVLPVMYFASTT